MSKPPPVDASEADHPGQGTEMVIRIGFRVAGDDELAMPAQQFVHSQVFDVPTVGYVYITPGSVRPAPHLLEQISQARPFLVPALPPVVRGPDVIGVGEPVPEPNVQQRHDEDERRNRRHPHVWARRRRCDCHRGTQVDLRVVTLKRIGRTVTRPATAAKVLGERKGLGVPPAQREVQNSPADSGWR